MYLHYDTGPSCIIENEEDLNAHAHENPIFQGPDEAANESGKGRNKVHLFRFPHWTNNFIFHTESRKHVNALIKTSTETLQTGVLIAESNKPKNNRGDDDSSQASFGYISAKRHKESKCQEDQGPCVNTPKWSLDTASAIYGCAGEGSGDWNADQV